ncbi:formate dehydrogenase family accessory protein FdhD [Methylophilaceae bacterium 11]|uniref:formate dehydrogenase accessory sulfurtransferase FdhD n=1 Tax=Methylotenera sp. N17 TaxID=1502761 RepID=UPI00044FA8AA|nr:formate dehydrogenase accessory sulfurtransferase FdhD [Methylotenera sp. N17]EUJ11470.1 formate dehydrogenase family accessory protein FdhD [Methylophilaceae bacterium 11]
MADWFAEDALSQQLSAQTYAVRQWRNGQFLTVDDRLAEEVPIALVYNGVSHAVMLASPQDLEDFALGFSLTEGIVQQKSDVYGVEMQVHANGIELHIEIATEQFVNLKARRRSMVGRTGCGLCGAESLSQVFRLPEQVDTQHAQQPIAVKSVLRAHQEIQALQQLQRQTGATHACAWADVTGAVEMVREDVGRHNALDKLIGALASQDRRGGFVLTTSRASYEMVQKVAMAGFDMLAAISAPTGLAVRIAKANRITLLGFVRDQQLVAYAHADRLTES